MDVAKIKRIIKNHGCASPAPHGDVLKKAKEQLKKKGYDLEVKRGK